MLVLILMVGRLILFEGVVRVEEEQVRRFSDRVLHAINNELSTLLSIANDWAIWDDTYAFVDSLDSNYIERNLSDQSLEAISVNTMAFVSSDKKLAFMRQRQSMVSEGVILEFLATELSTSVINDDGQMVFLARQSITDSLSELPSNGTLVVARVMSPEMQQRFENLLQVSISIHVADEATWLAPIIRLDDRHMIARSFVRETAGSSDFYIDAKLERTTNILAQRYMRLFLAIAVVAVVLFMLMLEYILQRYVLTRVNTLTKHLAQFAAAHEISTKPTPVDADEVLGMTVFVERLFEELQHTQALLKENEENFRMLFSSLPVGVAVRELILDNAGIPIDYKYLDVNPVYAQMCCFDLKDIMHKRLSEITEAGLELDLPEEYVTVALTGKPCRFDRLYGNGRWFDVFVYSPKPLQFASITIDITDRKISEQEVRSSQRDLEHLFNSLQDMLLVLDPQGIVLHVNDAVLKYLGYSRAELVGRTSQELHPDYTPEELAQNIADVVSGNKPTQPIPLRRKDGNVIPVETVVSLGRWGGQAATFAVARDITERQQAEEHLRYLSLHDQLTGLYNRTFFAAELERLSGGRDYPLSIICADANGLKLVNDTLGHLAGDELLKESSRILKACLRKSDILARVGGDEFAAILPNTDEDAAEAIVARIKGAAADHKVLEFDLPLSFSIGCATSTYAEQELEDIFLMADNLMYRDKLTQRANIRHEIFAALQKVLQAKDYYDLGHVVCLKELLSSFGDYLGLAPKLITDLHALAEVHDLGLIAIPDEVLHKPGRLTCEEREAIMQHPEKGYRIAYSSPELIGIAELILHHHEHWDGQGYPLHLTGEQIPFENRVFAIVDAFNVMTAGRPYCAARSVEQALAEIRALAGTQFDPCLAEQFCAMMTVREA